MGNLSTIIPAKSWFCKQQRRFTLQVSSTWLPPSCFQRLSFDIVQPINPDSSASGHRDHVSSILYPKPPSLNHLGISIQSSPTSYRGRRYWEDKAQIPLNDHPIFVCLVHALCALLSTQNPASGFLSMFTSALLNGLSTSLTAINSLTLMI